VSTIVSTPNAESGLLLRTLSDLALRRLERLTSLTENKVWEHMGLTLPEFLALHTSGAFMGEKRPDVCELLNLLATGKW
jgi:hypothetical protein